VEEALLGAVGAGLPDPLNFIEGGVVEVGGWSEFRVGIGGVVVGAFLHILDQVFHRARVTIAICTLTAAAAAIAIS